MTRKNTEVRMRPTWLKRLPVLLFIFVSAAIGISVIGHYGESWDELQFYKYADHALASYGQWLQKGEVSSVGNTYDYYGPSFVMGVTLIARLLSRLNPAWLFSDLRHLVYFLTFEVGVFSFYSLSRRWVNEWAAFGATLLFSTQPLVWGHAFISPKDIPFMAFFLASLASGLGMYERIFSPPPSLPASRMRSSVYEAVSRKWADLPQRSKRAILMVTFVWLFTLVALFLGTAFFDGLLESAIRTAYTAKETWLGKLFARIASDAEKVPIEVYIQKSAVLFIRLKVLYFIISTILVAWLYRSVFPVAYRYLGPMTLLAGVSLGLATSIRVLGPLAGLLVGLYMFLKSGKKALPLLLVYGCIVIFVAYITWPYLWPDPAGRFVDSLRLMAEYPWLGRVLFNTNFYPADGLPWFYLPFLLAIQFTEFVWPLFFAGLVVSVWQWSKKRGKVDLVLWVLLWFILPLLGLVASHSPLYDNFRQVFFILPPVFILAGVALEALLEKIRPLIIKAALLVILVLPGLYTDVHLHPYEYIYYNSYVGGVRGAFRRFEMDYWCISYREAANYLNRVAPPNAKVIVAGPEHIFATYAREDLSVFSDEEADRRGNYAYAVITARYNLDLESYPDAVLINSIQRNGAVLTVIKQLSPLNGQNSPWSLSEAGN